MGDSNPYDAEKADRTEAGYYSKFEVVRKSTGEEVEHKTFTLIPSRDPTARIALETYAAATEELDDNEELANDLREWLADI